MTDLRQPNGDDYPEAAARHLCDATVLLRSGRSDGAAYLAGYTVECAIKTLVQVETGSGARGHDLGSLQEALDLVASRSGARTARYSASLAALVGPARILDWEPGMRYHGNRDAVDPATARGWLREAGEVYSLVVGGLVLDRVIECGT